MRILIRFRTDCRLARYGLPLALALLAGCGSKTYPVQGRVVFEDDSPAKELAGYLIMFQSKEHQSSASGTIGPDGSFTVGTFKDNDGAMPGKQRVAITPPPPDIHKPRPPSRIPARYASFDTAQLEVDIRPETNRPTLKVERVKR